MKTEEQIHRADRMTNLIFASFQLSAEVGNKPEWLLVRNAVLAEIRAAENEAIERCENAAQHTSFRAHSPDDVDYHSGCEQTRDRIVDAIRALKEK